MVLLILIANQWDFNGNSIVIFCSSVFPKRQILDSAKLKVDTTILNWMKMAESSPNGLKTLWKKEKVLMMSNFSFSCSVFKRLVLQTRKNQGLFGKELTLYHTIPTFNDPEK